MTRRVETPHGIDVAALQSLAIRCILICAMCGGVMGLIAWCVGSAACRIEGAVLTEPVRFNPKVRACERLDPHAGWVRLERADMTAFAAAEPAAIVVRPWMAAGDGQVMVRLRDLPDAWAAAQ